MVYSSITFCNCKVFEPSKGVNGERKRCKEESTVLFSLQRLTECQRVRSSTAIGKQPLRADRILLYVVVMMKAFVCLLAMHSVLVSFGTSRA